MNVRITSLGLKLLINSAVVAGVLSCGVLIYKSHKRPTDLMKKEEFERTIPSTSVRDYSIMSHGLAIDLDVVDCNNDKKADALCWNGKAYWYTPDWNGDKYASARLMTPEIRDSVSGLLLKNHEASGMLLDETIRLRQSNYR